MERKDTDDWVSACRNIDVAGKEVEAEVERLGKMLILGMDNKPVLFERWFSLV